MPFEDRFDAGRHLAAKLDHYRGRSDVVVLALPRGGVPVAYEVAKALRAPLDVFLVRKLGWPLQPELAMGALAEGGVRILHDEVVEGLDVDESVIDRVAEEEARELVRQQELYRPGRTPPDVAGRTVILVDDGLATGSTMRAAVAALRAKQPAQLVVAVPVGAPQTCSEFQDLVDEVICAARPEEFRAVGMWYRDFSPTSDEQVLELLAEASRWAAAPSPLTHQSA
jgi:putative phosphoribosyl transferase